MRYAKWAEGHGPKDDILSVQGVLSDGFIAVEVVAGEWPYLPFSCLPSEIVPLDPAMPPKKVPFARVRATSRLDFRLENVTAQCRKTWAK